MAKKTGICRNLDCDNYKKEIEVEPGGDFECPLCHQPLGEGKKRNSKDDPNTGSPMKKIIIAVVALIVLAGGGYFAYTMVAGGDKEEPTTLESIALNQSSTTLEVGAVETLQVTKTPANAEATYIWTSNNEAVATVENGTVTLLKEGEATITVKALENESLSASCVYVVEGKGGGDSDPLVRIETGDAATGTGTGTISYHYGKYTGEIKNNKANGTGSLKFYKAYRLSQYDKQERMAESGDVVSGTFKDDNLTNGKWFDKDNTQKGAVLTGELGTPE
ncbi:Ig-like domain-containing protein [Bacteroides sp. 224]|uniref:Ig-like domain-containing protein n=1 Tax=Bacteroides sp. 224 TaxID=2302936 RepID=UPI0013D08516|nr:Ig-like domain-containing protein [Bacteroides sp. 224]NDV65266.1 hypothetical protein [Bacteroides sp. 224]